jgi:hypothetical protein
MLAKTFFCFMAFAALTVAAPAGDRSKQMARVKQLRAQGLVCNESFNSGGTFVCSDGFGGDWLVHQTPPPLEGVLVLRRRLEDPEN